MTQINSYLTFNGNCREAMTFYKHCIGGELYFQTIRESPLASKMPEKMKDCILHSTLTNGAITIMATDCVPEEGLIKGNAVSLCIDCNSEEEINKLYSVLADGGKATHPIQHTFWGAMFGDLTDKFGNNWLLNFSAMEA